MRRKRKNPPYKGTKDHAVAVKAVALLGTKVASDNYDLALNKALGKQACSYARWNKLLDLIKWMKANKIGKNPATIRPAHIRTGAVSHRTLATRRYDSARAPYAKIHRALMSSMSKGGGQYEALKALRRKRSGMSASNPKRKYKRRRK